MDDPILINDKQVDVRELAVKAMRIWIKNRVALEKSPDEFDPVDWCLFDDCTLHDLAFMSSLTMAEIEDALPSQLDLIRERCKAINPHFFAMRARVLVKAHGPE